MEREYRNRLSSSSRPYPSPCTCEPLEGRRLLTVSLSLSGTQAIAAGATINASSDPNTVQSEMSLVVNPSNPLNVVGFSLDLESPSTMDVYHSFDGGVTWGTTSLDGDHDTFEPGGDRFDPTLTFDDDGRLYVAYGIKLSQDTKLIAGSSTDGGVTFSNFRQIQINPEATGGFPGVDKWFMTAGLDPDSGGQAAYIAYNSNLMEGANLDQRVTVVGTRDGGDTWTAPLTINDGSITGTASGNIFACPAVDPTGGLYVTWHNLNVEQARMDRDLDGLWAGASHFGDVPDTIVRSGLDLFDTIIPAQPDRGILSGPVLTIDRSGGTHDGRHYLVTCERNGIAGFDMNIHVGRQDGGGAWTFTTIDSSTSTEFLPWIDIDQTTGSVNVIYFTTDGDQTGENVHPRLAWSTDGGVTWSHDDLSTQTSNESGGYDGDYLEYIGLDVHDGTAHGLWSARSGSPASDLDAFTASASFNHAGTNNTLSISAGTGDDTVKLRRSAINTEYLEVEINGAIEFAGLIASVDAIDLDAGTGADTVIVDFANGNPIPAGGLDATNVRSADTLRIDGSDAAEVGAIDTAGLSLNWNGATITMIDTLGSLVINGKEGNELLTVGGLQMPLTFNGGNDNDTLNVGFASGDLDTIDEEIIYDGGGFIVGGGGGTNTLSLTDNLDSGTKTYTVTTDTFDCTGFPLLTYSNIASLLITGLAGGGTYNFTGLPAAVAATVNAGSGDDLLNVGAVNGNAEDVNGSINFSGSTGTDQVILNDELNPSADTYDLTNSTLTRTGIGLVTYSGTQSIIMHAGTGSSLLSVSSTAPGTPATVLGGEGNDTFQGGAADWDSNLLGDVFVNGGSGTDSLDIDDTSDSGADAYTVTQSQTTKDSGGGIVSYDTIESYVLHANNDANTFVVNSTFDGDVSLRGRGGADTFDVIGNYIGRFVKLEDGGGLDVVRVNSDDVGAAAVQFTSSQDLASLEVFAGGQALLTSGGDKVIVTQALTVAPSGKLDLTNHDLILDYSGASPLSAVRTGLTSGYNGGAWTGNGITSSVAAVTSNRSLGYAEATDLFSSFPASFANQSIDNTAVLVRYTISGDANLDRTVDISDLGVLATNWQQSPRRWSRGDFNYDQVINISDLGILATNWQQTLPAPVRPVSRQVRTLFSATPLAVSNQRSLLDDVGLNVTVVE